MCVHVDWKTTREPAVYLCNEQKVVLCDEELATRTDSSASIGAERQMTPFKDACDVKVTCGVMQEQSDNTKNHLVTGLAYLLSLKGYTIRRNEHVSRFFAWCCYYEWTSLIRASPSAPATTDISRYWIYRMLLEDSPEGVHSYPTSKLMLNTDPANKQ